MLAIILAVENDEDREFLADLFDTYYPKLYIRAYSILRNDYEARSCAMATMERAVEKVEKFKKAHDENRLIKLLMITCRNICYNRHNYNKRRREKDAFITIDDPMFESEIYKSENHTADVEDLLINEYTIKLLHQLIGQLNIRYRDVIILYKMGLDYGEIAEQLCISKELVRKRYQRARKQLLLMGGDELRDVRREG